MVDNNSDDQTREVVGSFLRRCPHRIRYLFEPQQGKSHALNAGVREATGDIVAFMDDDVREAAQVMAKHQVRRLPVLNRNKRLVGVVALADLSRSGDSAAQGALKGISEPTDMQRRERIANPSPGVPPGGL